MFVALIWFIFHIMRTFRFATTISRCVNVCCLPRAAAAMEPVPHGWIGRDKWTASEHRNQHKVDKGLHSPPPHQKNAHFEEWSDTEDTLISMTKLHFYAFLLLGCQDSQHLLEYRRGQARKLDVLKDVIQMSHLGVIRWSCLIKVGHFWQTM